jgi:TP901-1 family phage major tail protein
MPPLKGLLFLLKRGDGGATETFETVAALRSTSLSINGESIDVTNKDSLNQMRELLDGGGVKSMDISGAGVFTEDQTQIDVEDDALQGHLWNYQVVFDGGRTYEGPFQVTSVEYSGEHNGEHTYSVELESGGDISISPSA